jgi:D-alanine-D-alanine ligase
MTSLDPGRFGKVALLLGGDAAEREISLKSGAAVLRGPAARWRRRARDRPRPDVLEVLRTGGFDRAFIILHGRGGEDGQMQGALERIGLPYTGSGVLGSAIGMDKYRTKLLWAGAGIPTAEFALLHDEADLPKAAALGFPLMIKPSQEGSSIGMAKVEDAASLERPGAPLPSTTAPCSPSAGCPVTSSPARSWTAGPCR